MICTPHVSRISPPLLIALLLMLCVVAPPARAADTLVDLPGNVSPLLSRSGAKPADAPLTDPEITIMVGLKPRDAAGLERLAYAAATPGDPRYGQFLTDDDYLRTYAPDAATVNAVVAYLRAQGLRNVEIDDSRLSVSGDTTLQAAARVFQTPINYFTTQNGRRAFANTAAPRIPASFAANVRGVYGLQSLSLRRVPKRSPADVTPQESTTKALEAKEVQRAYNVDEMLKRGYNGRGQRVGIVTLADYISSDIGYFVKKTGLPSAHPKRVKVGNTKQIDLCGSDPGDPIPPTDPYCSGYIESNLDIQAVHTTAPGAAISVFVGPNTDPGFLAGYQAAIKANVGVITASWGLCEMVIAPAVIAQYHTLFALAASKGISVLNSSGDSGYAECNGVNGPVADSVSHPASDPLNLAVGGTRLSVDATTGRATGESAWSCAQPTPQSCNRNTGGGGPGGGESDVFAMPDYQLNKNLPESPYQSNGFVGRHLPDISMLADGASGFVMAYSYPAKGTRGFPQATYYSAVSGTSIASPLLAGVLASGIEYRGARYGLVQPALYADGARRALDITTGDNGFAATTGWDFATGWGGIGSGKTGEIGAPAFLRRMPAASAKFGTLFSVARSDSTARSARITAGRNANTSSQVVIYVDSRQAQPINVTCSTSKPAAWLTISGCGGAPDEANTITLTAANPAALTGTSFSTTLIISVGGMGSVKSYKVPVTLRVSK